MCEWRTIWGFHSSFGGAVWTPVEHQELSQDEDTQWQQDVAIFNDISVLKKIIAIYQKINTQLKCCARKALQKRRKKGSKCKIRVFINWESGQKKVMSQQTWLCWIACCVTVTSARISLQDPDWYMSHKGPEPFNLFVSLCQLLCPLL